MARTKVHFEDKKQEYLQAVWKILFKYGYEKMTIAVIMKELNISRGAFYHYFQSKEDCVDQAISFYVQKTVQTLESSEKQNKAQSPAGERLRKAIADGISLFHEETEENLFLHQPENSVFHQKLMAASVKFLAPHYAAILQSGTESGDFAVDSPLETAEMLLTLSNFYLNAAIFQWHKEEMPGKIQALERLANKVLGTKEYISLFEF